MGKSRAVKALEVLGEIDPILRSAYIKQRREDKSAMALVDLKNRRGRSAANLLLSQDSSEQAEALLLIREHLNYVARGAFIATAPA